MKKTKKFTIVELLFSLGILSLIMLTLTSFFDMASRTISSSGTNLAAYADARLAIDMITRDLQCVFYDGTQNAITVSEDENIITMTTNSPFNTGSDTDSVISYTFDGDYSTLTRRPGGVVIPYCKKELISVEGGDSRCPDYVTISISTITETIKTKYPDNADDHKKTMSKTIFTGNRTE